MYYILYLASKYYTALYRLALFPDLSCFSSRIASASDLALHVVPLSMHYWVHSNGSSGSMARSEPVYIFLFRRFDVTCCKDIYPQQGLVVAQDDPHIPTKNLNTNRMSNMKWTKLNYQSEKEINRWKQVSAAAATGKSLPTKPTPPKQVSPAQSG